MTSLTVWRKPQRYGLEFEGLLYNSPDVAGFRVRPGRPDAIRVRVDPRDLSRVWFTDPESGALTEVPIVPAMRALVEGISLEKHKLARALQRQNPERLAGEAGLKRAYRILDAAMNLKANADGLKNRTQAARYASVGRRSWTAMLSWSILCVPCRQRSGCWEPSLNLA